MTLLQVMEKDLQGRSFENDGFIYTFQKVKSEESDDTLVIVVNVTLPNKHQSYAVPKFSQDINKFMRDYSNYFDKPFSIKLLILVDGEDVDGVYINPETLYEIKKNFQETIKKVSYRTVSEAIPVSFEVEFLSPRSSFFRFEDEYLNFSFPMNIKNIYLDNKKINTDNFDKQKLSNFSGYLNDSVIDESELREKMEDKLYTILEPQLKIEHTDLYYNANTIVSQIDGKDVHVIWGNNKLSDFIS